jgi:hypothetical protein
MVLVEGKPVDEPSICPDVGNHHQYLVAEEHYVGDSKDAFSGVKGNDSYAGRVPWATWRIEEYCPGMQSRSRISAGIHA